MHRTAEVRLWARTRWLTLGLLLVWLGISVAGPWFARELNGWQVFGFPAGYWIAAQGALLAFLAIIVVCIWQMERLEARCEADIAAERLAEAAPLAGAADSPEAT
jgi:putative solute:sodium symporter small subunit